MNDDGEEFRKLFVASPRWTLAVAESATCGRLQAAIGAISGASEFFLGGLTAYTLEQKVRHLRVDREMAAACDSVSAEVARQMARGALRLFGSDFAAATTGYAEPAPPRGFEQPAVYWAVARVVDSVPVIVAEGFFDRPAGARVAFQEAAAAEVMRAIHGATQAARRRG